MVSLQLIEELKTIMREDYKVELEQQEASEIVNSLVSFFELLLKVESKENVEH